MLGNKQMEKKEEKKIALNSSAVSSAHSLTSDRLHASRHLRFFSLHTIYTKQIIFTIWIKKNGGVGEGQGMKNHSTDKNAQP